MDNSESPVFVCDSCGDECEIVEEAFGYSGTHCNNGNPGIHRTGNYYSACCNEEYKEVDNG